MGNNSIKSSDKKLNKRNKHLFCCVNSSHSLSSLSNDGKYFPTFDRILSNKNPHSTSLHNVIVNLSDKKHELSSKKRIYYCQSIEDLQKSLHGTASIDQWIDSLPILGTPSLNRNKSTHPIRTVVSTNNKKIKRSLTVGDEYNENILNGSYRQVNKIDLLFFY